MPPAKRDETLGKKLLKGNRVLDSISRLGRSVLNTLSGFLGRKLPKSRLRLSEKARELKRQGKATEALDVHYEDLVRRQSGGKSEIFQGREIDSVTNDALIQVKRTLSAINKPHNFLNQKTRNQIKGTIRIANEHGKRAEFWFKYGAHPQVRKYIEGKGGTVRIGLGK